MAVGQPIAQGSAQTDRNKVGFELYRNYLIVVRGTAGTINGLNFLLDTGANPSILDARTAAKLHLNPAPTDIAVLNGSVRGGTTTVSSLGFGPIQRSGLPVGVEDLSFLEKALSVRIDGIIGVDMLGNSSFVIDYASCEIRFGPAGAMQASIPLQMKEGRAIVDATVNQATVHLLLDTGASALVLFEERPEPGAVAAHPSAKAAVLSDRKQVRLSSFALGPAEFGREAAFLVGNPRDAGHDFDGLMSPVALGMTRIAVDLGGGRLAFSRKP
jgi:hypothetical protein